MHTFTAIVLLHCYCCVLLYQDAASVMAGDALSAHEETKLKMRKAMADVTLVDEVKQLLK
jgi:hypothetical protein